MTTRRRFIARMAFAAAAMLAFFAAPAAEAAPDRAKQVLDISNKHRAAAKVHPLKLDPALCKLAQIRARELERRFSHKRPNGRSCFSVFRENGVRRRNMGENIALGYRNSWSVMGGWMRSKGHRANILSRKYRRLGVGCHWSPRRRRLYWVQVFSN